MTIDRRNLITGAAAAVAGMGAPAAAGDAGTPRAPYANPLDGALAEEIKQLEQAARGMKSLLAVAQADCVREGALFDLRCLLGQAHIALEFIGRNADEQARELRPDIYRGRRYQSPPVITRAAKALRDAGFSWDEAASLIISDEATASGFATAMRAREKTA